MDRIKKIKVKKSDGTFTDYLPLGSDAEYIDLENGNNLQEEIDHITKSYDNVAAMKVDETLKAGDICQTLGYYEINDGGNGLYKIINDSMLIEDSGAYHELNNGFFAELIVKNEINVKQFGAKGNNVDDDTTYIQNAINYAVSKVVNLIFPSGIYLITDTLTINTNGTLNHSSLVFSGIERQSSCIKAKTGSTMSSLIDISANSTMARNIILKSLYLHGNNIANIGVNITEHISESLFQDIKIDKCPEYGIKGIKNFYLTTLDKITVYNSNYGIYIYGGVNTSLNIKDGYCNNCANTSYKISGIYNTMQNCCADGQTNCVFDFSNFRGVAIGCGSESSQALYTFYSVGGRTNVTIVGAYT